MSRLWVLLTIVCLILLPLSASAETADNLPFQVNADSAILMDTATGTILYAKNAGDALMNGAEDLLEGDNPANTTEDQSGTNTTDMQNHKE